MSNFLLLRYLKSLIYNSVAELRLYYLNKMNGSVPHIVQYQGSKRNLAPQILPYFPQRFNRLIEPFAGMAAITIAVSRLNKAQLYHLNDLNTPLVSVLEEAINNPQRLLDDYTRVWNEQLTFNEGSVAHYYKVRDDFNSGNQCAANMLYLLARCVKGSVRYSGNGQFNQSPDKRRKGVSPANLSKNIFRISSYLKNRTEFSSVDYREVLQMARPGDIVYMDPPYQGVCATRDNRYFSGIDYNEFVESLEDLNRRGIDYIISYDGSCGDKQYGNDLPNDLGLRKVMLNAGLSSQALLLGKKEVTFEALYLSANLQDVVQPTVHNQLLFT